MSPRTLEVPVDSLGAATLAAPFATRLELCHDLASEGWTPKPDLVRACRDLVEGTACTIVAMIRPQFPGCRTELDVEAFTATPELLDRCRSEIETMAMAGAHSIAVALLSEEGNIDMEANARLIEDIRGYGLVPAFLRAFDLLTDRDQGMRDLTALGYVRVVTAGVLGWDASVSTLDERLRVVTQDVANARREAQDQGKPTVEVVPGGGVRGSNAARWLEVSPHLHASCRRDGEISIEELRGIEAAMGRTEHVDHERAHDAKLGTI